MRLHSTSLLRRALALAGAGALVLGACGSDDDSAEPTTPSEPTTAAPSTTAPVDDTEVAVYFVRDEHVAAAGRSTSDADPHAGALAALLAGPAGIETEIGMATAIPDGTELLDVTVAGGLAAVDLSGTFQSGGGSLSMTSRVAQVVFTMTAFADVDAVTILLDGAMVEAIGGEGVPANDLTRADFTGLTPMILVEEPTPGAEVRTPFTVAGFANVFEGTVSYTVTDADGLILDEGFTTAAAEELGTWGPFEFAVDVTPSRSGLGAVTVYEVSPRDGSRQYLVEIPVQLGAP